MNTSLLPEVIILGGQLSPEFIESEITDLETIHKRKIAKIEFTVSGNEAHERVWWVPIKFQRIRRITGYLTGDMTKWNNAKLAEEKDRVKHG